MNLDLDSTAPIEEIGSLTSNSDEKQFSARRVDEIFNPPARRPHLKFGLLGKRAHGK